MRGLLSSHEEAAHGHCFLSGLCGSHIAGDPDRRRVRPSAQRMHTSAAATIRLKAVLHSPAFSIIPGTLLVINLVWGEVDHGDHGHGRPRLLRAVPRSGPLLVFGLPRDSLCRLVPAPDFIGLEKAVPGGPPGTSLTPHTSDARGHFAEGAFQAAKEP